MINTKTKIYCLLLALLICVASANFSLGNTYARYNNAVSVSTVLDAPEQEMESNCLAMRSDAPVTVLAGELPSDSSPVKIPFKVKSSANAERTFSWSVMEAEYADYVSITVVHGGTPISSGDPIELIANEETEITITFALTTLARSEAHGEIELNIPVLFGDLYGTFRVIVPKSEGSVSGSGSEGGSANTPETGDENSGSEGETGETETPAEPENPGDNETGEGSEGTETPDSDINEQAVSEDESAFYTAIPAQTDAETETGANESDSSTGENDPSTEEPTTSTEEPGMSTDVPDEDPSDSEENQFGAGGAQNWVGTENTIKTVKSFDQKHKIPLMLKRTSTATAISFGIYKENNLSALPDYSRLSFDNGESWYVIINSCVPRFAVSEITGILLLDLSNANLEEEKTVVFAAEAFAGENSEGISKAEANVAQMSICETSVVSGTLEMQIAEAAETESSEEETARGGKILRSGESLVIDFPAEWIPEADSGYSLEYTVDLLTLSENEPRKLVRSPITTSNSENSGITTIYTADAENEIHNLVFALAKETPQAGTYAVNLKWNYQGICFYETRITFFINYSAQTVRPSES